MATSSRTIFLLCATLVVASPAGARSIAGKLHRFFDRNSVPTFGEFMEVITPELQRQAIRGIDYPVTATSPGLTYTFDFETGTAERSSEALGPVFVERADTVGRRRLDLGVSYLYGDLDQLDGHDVGDLVLAGERTDPRTGARFLQAFAARHFSLESQVLSTSATYGLTDAWDINVLLPLVWTRLALNGHVVAAVQPPGEPAVFAQYDAGLDATAFGVGDVLMRTKYRFLQRRAIDAAGVLALRVPTGRERDFQGIGDTTITPSLVLSKVFGPHDVHATLGIEINSDDLQRCRARYALGGSFQPWYGLAFLLDVLGSSSFTDDTFRVPGQTFHGGGNQQIVSAEPGSVTPLTPIVPRGDVVDLAIGTKIGAGSHVIAFLTAFVPMTSDGLRPEVIPAGGIEYTF